MVNYHSNENNQKLLEMNLSDLFKTHGIHFSFTIHGIHSTHGRKM